MLVVAIGANPQRRRFKKKQSRGPIRTKQTVRGSRSCCENHRVIGLELCPVTPDRPLAAVCRDTDAHVVSRLLLL